MTCTYRYIVRTFSVEALRSQQLVLILVLIFAGKIRVDAATACMIPLLPFVIDCSE